MSLLQKLLTTAVGFAFTLGAFGKASAKAAPPSVDGTVAIARESSSASFNSLNTLDKGLMVLANNDAQGSKDKGSKDKGSKDKTKSKPKSPKK